MNECLRKILDLLIVEDNLANDALIKRGLTTAVLVPAFRLLDWLLVVATASTFSFLKYYKFSEKAIWLIFWALNLILSGAVVLFNDRIKIDITLMQTLRKLVNRVFSRSWLAGLIVEVIIIGRLLIWDGPDQFIIFFRERLKSKTAKVSVFIAASGLQMFIWVKLYNFGYGSIVDFLKYLT